MPIIQKMLLEIDIDGAKLQPTLVVTGDGGGNVDTLALERDTKCIFGIAYLEQVLNS